MRIYSRYKLCPMCRDSNRGWMFSDVKAVCPICGYSTKKWDVIEQYDRHNDNMKSEDAELDKVKKAMKSIGIYI